MKPTIPWQQEESRIYLRDIYFLILIVFLSAGLAELFLIERPAETVDRLFYYLIVFVPLGTLNLAAHYYYRNRRIRVTGSLRSSLRYRLSLAFMFIAVIPSVPIFMVSSNVAEHLVGAFFEIDVRDSMERVHKIFEETKLSQTNPQYKADIRKFERVRENLTNRTAWKERIPSRLRLGLGLIFIFMICASLVGAVWIARQISTPIVTIAAATREVTDGRLDTRIELQADGELGILIDSFNQMTAELQSLRTRLLHSQRVAAWQEVAKRLAHEIKNPLTPIQLSADRMIRRLEHPEKGELQNIVSSGARTIREQVQVLKSMVEEFADFARMPEPRPTLQSIDAIAGECGGLYQSVPGVKMEMRLAGNLPDIALDKNMIVGMINNLIKNALEAIGGQNPENDEPGRILVSTALHTQAGRKFVMLRVEDSGPGIDEGMKDRVFEPYYSTKGEHGSGLGLALVERTVLEHNARITVSRSSLGGAEFRILFPIPMTRAG